MAILNYILEANIGLIIAGAFYFFFLRNETRFGLMRIYLLASIFSSLVFPLVSLAPLAMATPLSVSQVIPTYWLPEVAIGGTALETENTVASVWQITTMAYGLGLFILFSFVTYQLVQLFKIIRSSATYRRNNLRIAESTEDMPTFSFFNFIFIGKANDLSTEEKEQIIRHESVHAQRWHSFDILLINILRIVFWFNPVIGIYKKTFIQLHEFEADARAVENSDVNRYCSLLARVALQSADFRLANHFNNSLTVKRIEMMRTLKSNIKRWKLIAIVMVVPTVFFFVACQDQVVEDMKQITQNSSHALIVPEYIQGRFDQTQKANPEKKYVLLELNGTASQKLEDMRQQYGLPKSIEVIKTVDGKVFEEGPKGSADNIIIRDAEAGEKGDGSIKLRRVEPAVEGERTFAIIEFTDDASRISEAAAGSQEDKIFTVVEHQPEFAGGYDAMMSFIKSNLRYPASARQQGIEGTVFASFIVEKDGAVSSVKIVRGISPECDQEVVRVVESFPNWIPAQHGGNIVRVQFVLPIKFNL